MATVNTSNNVRQILHDTYSFIRSQEANQATASITLDHLIENAINSLKSGSTIQITDSNGNNTGVKASRYDQLTDLASSLNLLVQALQNAGNDSQKLAALGLLPEDG